jgi:TolB protein
MRNRWIVALFVAIAGMSLEALSQRQPVLKQIDEPHSYYYREMYLPQLTTGPGSLAWSPDSKFLIYSMSGYLWRQDPASQTAEQLTASRGYDYQPDCSPDGRWIVYASYLNDAVELWAFDVSTKQAHQLTHGGAVNVEPRFSPDGRRLVFVSTSYHGHFHIFAADFAQGTLSNVQQLVPENKSSLRRYYYSAIDHEISPVWSPDGSEILFVSNKGHIYGSGGLWRMKAVPGSPMREIHFEETTWKARPDFAPDGSRIVFASYAGRNWHQLWLMPAQGGEPIPLSYGEFDNINPRWSKDGKSIAYISNRDGNTAIWLQEIPGGKQRQLVIANRRFLNPVAHVSLAIEDATGVPTPARVFITGSDGRAYAPDDAWMIADDGFVRKERAFEAHYFHTAGKAELSVPAGKTRIEVMKGFLNQLSVRTIDLNANQTENVTIKLEPLDLPEITGSKWVSGDVHVHMNYAGAYRNTPANMVRQASAEGLDIVEDLVVNKEQRIPDMAYFKTKPFSDPASPSVLAFGQEFHTSYWGHLGLLGSRDHFLLLDYAGYPGTAAASLVPMNADVADLAHQQGALVGYVHPFEQVPDPSADASITDEFPVDVALGKVDYIEIVGFSDHKSTADVWYRILNLGFHLPAAAGTDAMSNYASMHGPVGLDRVFAKVPAGPVNTDQWLSSIKAGHTFATNGPLLGFTVDGHDVGDQIDLPAGPQQLQVTGWMRSLVPVDHLDVVCNGKAVNSVSLAGQRVRADFSTTIPISESTWCLLRASSDHPEFPILDYYPYASTTPIYMNVVGSPLHSNADAAYFVSWIDRLITSATQNEDWNNPEEKKHVLDTLQAARKVYVGLE